MTNFETLWRSPSRDLTLSSNEVHLWRAALNTSAGELQALSKILSADEQLRAEQFHFEQHRKRFITARGLLRTLLSRYLDMEPHQLQFSYTAHGKPALANTCGNKRLRFNLSHSQDWVVYAFAWDVSGYPCKVGIDLEYLRPFPQAEQIAKRFFSAQEYAVLRTLARQQQQKAFILGWTRKEAYLKATGEGLAGSLEQVEVSLSALEPAQLLKIVGDSEAASCWSLHDLNLGRDYVGTLAIFGHGWHLRHWQF